MIDDSLRPLLIGVSARIYRPEGPVLDLGGVWTKTLHYLEQSVAHWVMHGGAMAVMIPAVDSESVVTREDLNLNHYAQALDGLVLQGGNDVAPQTYGEKPIDPRWPGDRVRDRYEMELVRAFVDAGKPVFGICRGLQLINVACGGTLHQDLLAEGASAQAHSHADAYDRHSHGLHIAAGTWLSSRYDGATTGRVNSIHHQGIARLGAGLVAEAQAEDGVIECVRGSGAHFLLGVQWHPEFHDGSDPDLLPADPLLQAFLDAAAQRRG